MVIKRQKKIKEKRPVAFTRRENCSLKACATPVTTRPSEPSLLGTVHIPTSWHYQEACASHVTTNRGSSGI